MIATSIKKAKQLIAIEAAAVKRLQKRINADFLKAIELIVSCRGRVIVSGMGKTGIIGRKISATFSSTGTPSLYMHPAEAAHGDLGQVTKDDVLILISYSGETDETKRLIPLIKKIGAPVIAMTGEKQSSLARFSDVILDISVEEEGCPLGLAPMASTTAALVFGDALAASLIVRKKFRREDFAFYHPGGALGRRLLLTVGDIMRTGRQYARVRDNSHVKDVLFAITRARCGSACVVDAREKFVGIFTDGDLRRHMETHANILRCQVKDVMTVNPITVQKDKLAAEALKILQDRKIDELPVLDGKGNLAGLLDIQDLLKAGLL
ncbi:MAG: KpsF/GutQ family sugar-phosphate isomerase [Candidatus Omnitrophica bacterium]|nr:KpsF/GutQ family sugar-phosphate isomerase [Candidatus Omnitrophota bacterium]